jgi:hypothetical protein
MVSEESTVYVLFEPYGGDEQRRPDMDGINERVVCRHGRKSAQQIAATMREVMFEVMMVVSTTVLLAALATLFFKG